RGIEVRGLMTLAPWGQEPELARPTFRAARLLRDELARRFPQAAWHELSMGMTDDFEVAVEEGATLVRVGRAIFGAREPAGL
ncbi:MAG TPA: YggS family pyridoxal phosphate-dependent enzyme, partial [Alphaproteobacteria bacterium]|nr:YggS family pyridoxal phosphate-dependent enzyme [Alphaproteobacteria bacterium]